MFDKLLKGMIKMKKTLYIIISILFIPIVFSGCGADSSGENSEEKITLKVGSYGADDSIYHELAVKPWMNKVEELTDNQVDFDFYPSEQLGDIEDLLELTQDNVADIGSIGVNNYADELPYSDMIGGLPGLYENAEEGVIAYRELLNNNPEIEETDYSDNGVKFLLGYVMAPYEIYSTDKEVRTPEDLKGVKVQATGKKRNDLLSFMEASPTSITFADSYEAMERGVVNATLYSANPIQTSGVSELVKHHLPVGLGSTIISLTINEDVWDDLPDNIKEAMDEAADEVTKSLGENFDEEEDNNLKELIDDGLETVELSEEEEEQWHKFKEDFNKKWFEENNSGEYDYEKVLNDFEQEVNDL